MLLLPPSPSTSHQTSPLLKLPPSYTPKRVPYANLKRYTGRILDRTIGFIWWFFVLIGAGNAAVGIGNCVLGLGAWTWWRGKAPSPGSV